MGTENSVNRSTKMLLLHGDSFLDRYENEDPDVTKKAWRLWCRRFKRSSNMKVENYPSIVAFKCQAFHALCGLTSALREMNEWNDLAQKPKP